MPRRRNWKCKLNKKSYDFKSKLERDIGQDLVNRGVKFEYEKESFKYMIEVSRSLCPECGYGPAILNRSYTPDFFLDNGIIVEAKGKFTAEERKKHASMKEQYPDMDLRMLFQSNNWITKRHKKRYSSWCDSKGIKWAVGNKIPEEWLK